MASLRSLFYRSQQLRPSILAATKTSPTTITTATTTTTTTPTIQRSCAVAAFSSSATSTSSSATSARPSLHGPRVPTPTPFIPDVETFLTVIGRNLKQHASKFPTWDSLFALSSQQMRDLGVEPARSRKYLMRWRRRFLNEEYGPGGEFQHVKDGVAELRVLEVQKKPSSSSSDASAAAAAAVPAPPIKMRCVVNMPEGVRVEDVVGTADAQKFMSRVIKYKPQGRHEVVGPYAIPLGHGKGASVKVTEGMWEDKQGHKIDGGERRQTKVRYKKRILERRQARERAQGHN